MTGGAGDLLVHGTCVTLGQRGVLLRGAPGSGKSDLALRLISFFNDSGIEADTARLVSDDQVLVSREGDRLVARPPEAIAGRLEVRGVGVVAVPYRARVSLVLIADMSDADAIPRLPPDPLPHENVLGVPVPVLALNPFEASSPAKLKLALTRRP